MVCDSSQLLSIPITISASASARLGYLLRIVNIYIYIYKLNSETAGSVPAEAVQVKIRCCTGAASANNYCTVITVQWAFELERWMDGRMGSLHHVTFTSNQPLSRFGLWSDHMWPHRNLGDLESEGLF